MESTEFDLFNNPWFLIVNSSEECEQAIEFLVQQGYPKPVFTYQSNIRMITNMKSNGKVCDHIMYGGRDYTEGGFHHLRSELQLKKIVVLDRVVSNKELRAEFLEKQLAAITEQIECISAELQQLRS